jgi:hypothetical protein
VEKFIASLYYHGMFTFCSVLCWGGIQYRAYCSLRDAAEEFKSWRACNPGVYIGLSDVGKVLVRRWIEAFDHFYLMHPWFSVNTEAREALLRLLDELPPKSPSSVPVHESAPALFLFSY